MTLCAEVHGNSTVHPGTNGSKMVQKTPAVIVCMQLLCCVVVVARLKAKQVHTTLPCVCSTHPLQPNATGVPSFACVPQTAPTDYAVAIIKSLALDNQQAGPLFKRSLAGSKGDGTQKVLRCRFHSASTKTNRLQTRSKTESFNLYIQHGWCQDRMLFVRRCKTGGNHIYVFHSMSTTPTNPSPGKNKGAQRPGCAAPS